MDGEVDLTELDDWLGTLEELQLGLEKEKTFPCHSGSVSKATSKEPLPSGHVNHVFLSEPSSPKHLVPCPRKDAHFNPVPREIGRSVEAPHSTLNASTSLDNRSACSSNLGRNFTRHNSEFNESVGLNGCTRSDPPFSTHTFKDAAAERDLNSLLRDLEVVEERMKELEQENTSFSRRYSLASSPTSNQPTEVQGSDDSKLNYANKHDDHRLKISPNKENGFISAQWAAELNRDAQIVTQRGPAVSTTQASPPPAFLGAGDACMSPPTSPQPPTPSLGLLQQTEAGLWCVTHNSVENASNSHGPGNGFPVRQRLEVGRPMSDDGQPMSTRLLSEACYKNGPAVKSPSREHYQYPGANAQLRSTGLPSPRTGPPDFVDHSISATPSTDHGLTNAVHTHIPNCTHTPQQESFKVNDSVAMRTQQCSREWGLSHQSTQLSACTQPNKAKDGEDDRSLSGIGSWSPGHPPIRRDKMKSHSLAEVGEIDRLSHSISPESSLSDKSNPDSNQSITYSRDGMERSQIKKLVVRIFRPDRTTKAIMIDEQMTAGEIASMLIEKNFLKPSTSLAVVEKVPALKIERVFEEHDKVSECILSWPTGSQNMIFFEDRKDHFGFIESPKYWFGDEFAEVNGYNSADAVQTMLSNLEQVGFPEWRDYLYIRKPGEKTWSRRFCVLRSSGLYTSKRNKKSLSSTDLIRILVLDSPLQLYTTTGGWSRLRAPTPHGFAFKPYSAQDPTSKHVFCFCATDEKALRNWICRLRIAKFGRQLFTNYQNSMARVQRQIAIRHAPPGGLYNMNGSLSAYIQRKSSFDILTSSTSTIAMTPAESASSLTLNTGSPSVPKRILFSRNQQPDSKPLFADPRFGQVTNRCALENERPVSPLLLRFHQSTAQATSQNKPYPIGQTQMANSNVDRGLTSRVNYALPQSVIAGSQTSNSGSYQSDRKPTTINYV